MKLILSTNYLSSNPFHFIFYKNNKLKPYVRTLHLQILLNNVPSRAPAVTASTAFKAGSAASAQTPPTFRVQQFHSSPVRNDEAKTLATPPAEEAKSLWDPLYAIPLGFTFAIPAIHNEWFIVNEETLLTSVFLFFCITVYTQAGEMVHKGLVEKADTMLAEQNELEDAVIDCLQDLHKDIEKLSGNLVQDFEAIAKVTDETYHKLNTAGAIKPQHDFKAQVEKVLHLIQQEEINVKEKAKTSLMVEATEKVKADFLSSKEMKKAAMDLAMAKLAGTTAKADPVKDAFIKFFKDKAAASKGDDKAELLEQREAMVAKLNATAKNEGFFFVFDDSGKPKMVVWVCGVLWMWCFGLSNE